MEIFYANKKKKTQNKKSYQKGGKLYLILCYRLNAFQPFRND